MAGDGRGFGRMGREGSRRGLRGFVRIRREGADVAAGWGGGGRGEVNGMAGVVVADDTDVACELNCGCGRGGWLVFVGIWPRKIRTSLPDTLAFFPLSAI